MAAVRWEHVRFTEHMTEAAAVVGECHVVFDFGPAERATYAVRVYEALKGDGAPYFAVATNQDVPGAHRPVGSGPSAEAALQACLDDAGIYHRRRVKQAGDA